MKIVRRHIDESKKFGYCNNLTHRGWLSVQATKDHGCLNKQCPFFKINKDHPYVQQKERQKMENKVRKHLQKVHMTWTKQKCYELAHSMDRNELERYIEEIIK